MSIEHCCSDRYVVPGTSVCFCRKKTPPHSLLNCVPCPPRSCVDKPPGRSTWLSRVSTVVSGMQRTAGPSASRSGSRSPPYQRNPSWTWSCWTSRFSQGFDMHDHDPSSGMDPSPLPVRAHEQETVERWGGGAHHGYHSTNKIGELPIALESASATAWHMRGFWTMLDGHVAHTVKVDHARVETPSPQVVIRLEQTDSNVSGSSPSHLGPHHVHHMHRGRRHISVHLIK